MTMEDPLLERMREVYQPKVDDFFKKLGALSLSSAELEAVPALLLPSWGTAYNAANVKFAIIGKEALTWSTDIGDSLKADLDAWQTGRYDVAASCNRFRDEGPTKWQNPFWQYVAAALAKFYGRPKEDIIGSANSPLANAIAWHNSHAVETFESRGVENGRIEFGHMESIQTSADACGLSSVKDFIDVFQPDVILYLYRNSGAGSAERILPEGARNVRSWGDNDDIHEYRFGRTLLLHMRHTTYDLHGNLGQEAFADLVNQVLAERGIASGAFVPEALTASPVTHLYDLYGMSATVWREWLDFVRREADKVADEEDNYKASRHLMLKVADRLCSANEQMTAQTLVLLLNEIDRFRNSGWQYSEKGRGPCSSVRGAYNAYVNAGSDDDAGKIANAFTKLNGRWAYE